MDIEIVRLYGQRLLESEIVGGIVHDEIETLQETDQGDLYFLPCKRTAL